MDSTTSNKISTTTQAVLSAAKGVASNTNCPKMGSRRIFTPQFKLQVLESYRNDQDCKGNQRATARKYNIHRRQIQKWLQCEESLRSSVVNINQNAVKHQFHNVSMQQQQQQQTKNVSSSTQAAANGLSCTTASHLQSTHLCLEATKGTTSHKTIEVPSLASSVCIASSQETRDILATTSDISATAIVSPLRPSAVISAGKSANVSMSPLLHHHHHHHYGIQTFSNVSSSSTVPILVHHLNNTQQIYQYENIHYTPPTLTHHQTDKDHNTYLAPLVFPPTAVNNSYSSTNAERLLLMGAKTYPKTLSEKSFLYNNNQFHPGSECSNASRYESCSSTLEAFNLNQFPGDTSFSSAFTFGPMDLSLRHTKDTKPDIAASLTTSYHQQVTSTPIKKLEINNALEVVDLTYRKRRVSNVHNSNNDYKYEYPEKQQKLSAGEVEANNKQTLDDTTTAATTPHQANASNNNEEEDVEIEVGTEEKFPPTSKPVKLFKPYLLDEYDNNNDGHHLSSNKNKSSKTNLPEAKVVEKDDTANVNDKTFPDTIKENINICVDSSNFFVESRSESPRSACSPATCISSTLSPTNFHYSKGSPASSGYESSTSTYSDHSLSSKNDIYPYGQTTTYSLNLQMQTIYQESSHDLHPSKHVQRWLEKEDSNSLETNPSIALFV